MEVDFLELLEFIDKRKQMNVYKEFLDFIGEIDNIIDKEIEIKVPIEIINDFMLFKQEFDNQ